MNMEQPEGLRPNTLEWVLLHDSDIAYVAKEYGITAQTSDEELDGPVWLAVRAAYEEDYSFSDEEMLAALKAVRQAVS